MALEKFKPRTTSGNKSPLISIRKSGSFGINQSAIEEFFDDSEYVVLLYDEENNKVGFQPKQEDTQNSYVISKGDSGGSITAMALVNRYDIEHEVTTRYAPERNEDGVIIIDLNEPVGTYGEPDEQSE